MEMMWIVALLALVVGGVAGFFIGRSTSDSKERITELETEVSRHKEEIAEYKKDVETHFDKTATLFVDMAGSYKALFEHLSADYEKLSEGSARELFKERVSAMLLEGDASSAPKAIAHSSADSSAKDDAVAKPAETSPEVATDATDGTGQADSVTPAAEEASKPVETEKAGEQSATEPKAETEVKAEQEEPAPPVAVPDEKADGAQADKSVDAAEKTTDQKNEGLNKVDPEVSQAADKPVGDEGETTLERAAQKRAESAAGETKPEDKAS